MKRKILLLLAIMMSLSGMAQSTLSDYVSINFPDVNVPQGGTGEMAVTWNNRIDENIDKITAFQIEFILPEGINLVDAKLGEKIIEHNPKMTFQYNPRRESDGYTVIVALDFFNLTPMPTGENELMRLTFEAKPDMPLGKYAVNTSKIEFAHHNDYYLGTHLPTHTFNINVVDGTIVEPIVGDVNDDGSVTLADAICIFSWLLEQEPPVFVEERADFNEDNVVSVSDAIAIIKYVVTANTNVINPDVPDEDVAKLLEEMCHMCSTSNGFDITLGDLRDFTAFTADITLGDDATLLSATLGTHNVATHSLGGGRYRIVAWSMDMAPIGAGAVLHCKTTGGNTSAVTLDHIRIVDMNTREHAASAMECSPTGIRNLGTGTAAASMTNDSRRYDISGRAATGSTRGIVISQGKKYATPRR